MRIDWRNLPGKPLRCRVVNLETGKQIAACAMADEEAGLVEQYVMERIGFQGMNELLRFHLDPVTKRAVTVLRRVRCQIVPLQADEAYYLPMGEREYTFAATLGA